VHVLEIWLCRRVEPGGLQRGVGSNSAPLPPTMMTDQRTSPAHLPGIANTAAYPPYILAQSHHPPAGYAQAQDVFSLPHLQYSSHLSPYAGQQQQPQHQPESEAPEPVQQASQPRYADSSTLYDAAIASSTGSPPGSVSDSFAARGVTRLPPILQVEKQHVTTTATQAASASRRRNDAQFKCPVPGCGSTFTRRFNLRGHLRSHTEERPFVCEWPGCGKGFARQHDCKRHQALHGAKSGSHACAGCNKSFSRMDALNRHCESSFSFICATCCRYSCLGLRCFPLTHARRHVSETSAPVVPFHAATHD